MGTLQAWLRFPLNAPERIVLAGLRTSVDGGSMGNGTELFHTLCALHCSGVGEAVLSRWAVGGESSAALLRELLGGLPGNSLSQAWGSAKATQGAGPRSNKRAPVDESRTQFKRAHGRRTSFLVWLSSQCTQ